MITDPKKTFVRLCVKWLTICEALPDKKASKIGSYYLLANQCFELLTKVTDFTKRVYERLIRTRIRLGTLTEHSPDRPTKHLHFRYPEKDMQVTPLGASFSGIDGTKQFKLKHTELIGSQYRVGPGTAGHGVKNVL